MQYPCELKVNFSIILVVKLFYRLSFWQLPFLHSRLRWETSNPSSQYNFSTDVMQVSAVGVSYCRAYNFQVNHGCCFYSKVKVELVNLGPRAWVNDLHFCQHQESRVPIETITLFLTVWLHHDGRISVGGFDYSHLLWLFDDLFSQQGKMYTLHYACTIAISISSYPRGSHGKAWYK